MLDDKGKQGKPQADQTSFMDDGNRDYLPETGNIQQGSGRSVYQQGVHKMLDKAESKIWEEVYLKEYETVKDAISIFSKYSHFYNNERLHKALGYKTSFEVC